MHKTIYVIMQGLVGSIFLLPGRLSLKKENANMAQPSKGKNTKGTEHLNRKSPPTVSANDFTGLNPANPKDSLYEDILPLTAEAPDKEN